VPAQLRGASGTRRGRVRPVGGLPERRATVPRIPRRKGYVVPELWVGMSGPMNTALFVYRYADGKAHEDEDRTLGQDREYAEVASSMPYREGSLHYELFRAA
jgi:hypothetical protein